MTKPTKTAAKKPTAKKPAVKKSPAKKTPTRSAKSKKVLGYTTPKKADESYPKPDALPPLDPGRLLRPQEAADRLTVSLSTLRRLIKVGRLPVVRVGHAIRIRPQDLEVFAKPTPIN